MRSITGARGASAPIARGSQLPLVKRKHQTAEVGERNAGSIMTATKAAAALSWAAIAGISAAGLLVLGQVVAASFVAPPRLGLVAAISVLVLVLAWHLRVDTPLMRRQTTAAMTAVVIVCNDLTAPLHQTVAVVGVGLLATRVVFRRFRWADLYWFISRLLAAAILVAVFQTTHATGLIWPAALLAGWLAFFLTAIAVECAFTTVVETAQHVPQRHRLAVGARHAGHQPSPLPGRAARRHAVPPRRRPGVLPGLRLRLGAGRDRLAAQPRPAPPADRLGGRLAGAALESRRARQNAARRRQRLRAGGQGDAAARGTGGQGDLASGCAAGTTATTTWWLPGTAGPSSPKKTSRCSTRWRTWAASWSGTKSWCTSCGCRRTRMP